MFWAQNHPGDAHDAGFLGATWQEANQLMLMMLGLLGAVGQEAVQLMLMTLAFLGSLARLMLMMLA